LVKNIRPLAGALIENLLRRITTGILVKKESIQLSTSLMSDSTSKANSKANKNLNSAIKKALLNLAQNLPKMWSVKHAQNCIDLTIKMKQQKMGSNDLEIMSLICCHLLITHKSLRHQASSLVSTNGEEHRSGSGEELDQITKSKAILKILNYKYNEEKGEILPYPVREFVYIFMNEEISQNVSVEKIHIIGGEKGGNHQKSSNSNAKKFSAKPILDVQPVIQRAKRVADEVGEAGPSKKRKLTQTYNKLKVKIENGSSTESDQSQTTNALLNSRIISSLPPNDPNSIISLTISLMKIYNSSLSGQKSPVKNSRKSSKSPKISLNLSKLDQNFESTSQTNQKYQKINQKILQKSENLIEILNFLVQKISLNNWLGFSEIIEKYLHENLNRINQLEKEYERKENVSSLSVKNLENAKVKLYNVIVCTLKDVPKLVYDSMFVDCELLIKRCYVFGRFNTLRPKGGISVPSKNLDSLKFVKNLRLCGVP